MKEFTNFFFTSIFCVGFFFEVMDSMKIMRHVEYLMKLWIMSSTVVYEIICIWIFLSFIALLKSKFRIDIYWMRHTIRDTPSKGMNWLGYGVEMYKWLRIWLSTNIFFSFITSQQW